MRNSVKGIAIGTVFSALGLVAFNASAQECYRSTECEGNLICVDLTCVLSDTPQNECTEEASCEYLEICDQGVCKPDGVACANELGHCAVDSAVSQCGCESGEGMWSGSDGEVEVITDEVLYEMCTDMLAESCEAPPDVTEVCTEDEITQCTDILVQMNSLEENCESDEPIETIDYDTEEDIGDVDTEGAEIDSEGDIESTDGAAEDPAVAASVLEPYEPSAWEIADCCEELAEIAEDPEEQEYLDCIMALDVDDCDSLALCEEAYSGDVDISVDDKEDTAGDGDTESAGENNNDGKGDTAADDADTETDIAITGDNADTEADAGESDTETDIEEVPSNDNKDDSGCSFVSTARPADIFSLIETLL